MARSFDSRLRVKTDYLAALTLTLAPLLYFSSVLLKHGVLCPDDGILQNIPLRIVIAHMIRSGYVPLWNPYIFSEPNRVEIKTTSSEPSILVLTDNYYSGWRAYLDGGAVETLRVNYNLRGVPLAGGNHRVEFFYRPKAVLIGLIISLLTLALLVLWAKRPLLRPAK